MQNEKHDPSMSCISCMTLTWHLKIISHRGQIKSLLASAGDSSWSGDSSFERLGWSGKHVVKWVYDTGMTWALEKESRPPVCLWCSVRASGTVWRVYSAADNPGFIWNVDRSPGVSELLPFILPQGRSERQSSLFLALPPKCLSHQDGAAGIKFLAAAPAALEKFHCSERSGYHCSILGLLSGSWFGGGSSAMFCKLGFERPWQGLPRNEEQGNVEVSLPDLLLKSSDNTY